MTPGCYGWPWRSQCWGIIIQEVRAGSESLTSSDALVFTGPHSSRLLENLAFFPWTTPLLPLFQGTWK